MIFEPGRTFISRHILHTLMHLSHHFSSASKPAACKPFQCCLSHFRTWSDINCHFQPSLREFLDAVVNLFTPQTLPTVSGKHLFMNIPCIESLCSQETHNRTLLFSNTLLKHGRQFYYWNQPLNMRMRVCYSDYHEAGLCCYLVVHIHQVH
jgi:hypothetical protein